MYLQKKNIKLQLMEPHNHRVNAAEHAIQIFKDHFISGLCTIDKDFPAQLWNELLERGQESLNMLRTSRIHPQLSAYASLEGAFYYNLTPWAPSGTVRHKSNNI